MLLVLEFSPRFTMNGSNQQLAARGWGLVAPVPNLGKTTSAPVKRTHGGHGGHGVSGSCGANVGILRRARDYFRVLAFAPFRAGIGRSEKIDSI